MVAKYVYLLENLLYFVGCLGAHYKYAWHLLE